MYNWQVQKKIFDLLFCYICFFVTQKVLSSFLKKKKKRNRDSFGCLDVCFVQPVEKSPILSHKSATAGGSVFNCKSHLHQSVAICMQCTILP